MLVFFSVAIISFVQKRCSFSQYFTNLHNYSNSVFGQKIFFLLLERKKENIVSMKSWKICFLMQKSSNLDSKISQPSWNIPTHMQSSIHIQLHSYTPMHQPVYIHRYGYIHTYTRTTIYIHFFLINCLMQILYKRFYKISFTLSLNFVI